MCSHPADRRCVFRVSSSSSSEPALLPLRLQATVHRPPQDAKIHSNSSSSTSPPRPPPPAQNFAIPLQQRLLLRPDPRAPSPSPNSSSPRSRPLRCLRTLARPESSSLGIDDLPDDVPRARRTSPQRVRQNLQKRSFSSPNEASKRERESAGRWRDKGNTHRSRRLHRGSR